MGINGLLPLLKSIHKPCNLKKFEGKTLGVDAYGWLHRGTVACAMELAQGKPTRKFVDFSMHRVRMLQHFGVTPFLIFDGDYLPSKAATETDRSKRREESKRAGLELLNAGKISQAYTEFQKAVDVTPEMARQLIEELKKSGIQYVVAPYEADAQMAYLERKGIIDGIISEDSDLLVFGAKCLLTKLDQYGNCVEINKADFSACRDINLTGWSDAEFRRMAILSGCDYLVSINNMGLKTAYRMIRKHKTIEKVLRMLQFDGKYRVPTSYLSDFYQAEFTFLHQRVYCPLQHKLVLHTDPEQPINLDEMPYIGADVEPEIARGVATGDLNPMTKNPIRFIVRGNNTSPATPMTTSNPRLRGSARAGVSDTKKPKTMDNFFKRRPLAELDINCFTPSPSQQNVLERNSGSHWEASPARPYIDRSITEPEIPRSAPPPSLNTSRPLIRESTASEPRPPKRARLCGEPELVTSPNSGQKFELSRSRFFGAGAEPSPSAGKASRSRRNKKTDITIFSDDSVEEAMLSLPDFDGFRKEQSTKGDKIAIFKEVDGQKDVESRETTTIHQIDASEDCLTPRVSDPGMTSSMSVSSSCDQPATPGDTTGPLTITDLKSRFSFSATASTPQVSSIVHGQFTPITRPPNRSRIPLATKTNASAPKAQPIFSTKTKMTPLQRLGANAAGRFNLPMTPPVTPLPSAIISKPRKSMLFKGTVPFPEVCEGEAQRINPATIPLPNADEAENWALINGSEDLIIHDSEEDEPFSPVATESRINFKRFIYASQ
ncbi:hypothetical protein B0O99DRAFT_594822 [Bisporella sp. PMI_857]|nr:hypothetical protein B0O99DRAFT_594822 [Bisporella sp. PMI_857]